MVRQMEVTAGGHTHWIAWLIRSPSLRQNVATGEIISVNSRHHGTLVQESPQSYDSGNQVFISLSFRVS
jgi:hypothetical protein